MLFIRLFFDIFTASLYLQKSQSCPESGITSLLNIQSNLELSSQPMSHRPHRE